MSFVVDGADWDFNGLTAPQIQAHIETILAFVETSRKRRETIWVGDDFQSRAMLGALSLWDLASMPGLPHDMFEELTAWLNRAPLYTDEANWPDSVDDTDIGIGGGPLVANTDIAWVHHSVRTGIAMASLSVKRRGAIATQSSQGNVDVHFLADDPGRIGFWRYAIVHEGDNSASLTRFAPHAYPNIYFAAGALAGVNDLAGGYLALRTDVQAALVALDEHGEWIFTEAPPAVSPNEPRVSKAPPPTNQIIEKRFRNVALDAAPEKPIVWQKLPMRRAREVKVGDVTLYCEWHIRLEKHRNRIHVHAPVKQSANKVIVGIIHEHLPLPPT